MGKSSIADKEMAADLRKRGIWHGKRTTSTHSHTPHPSDPPGSAAYRRLQEARDRRGK